MCSLKKNMGTLYMLCQQLRSGKASMRTQHHLCHMLQPIDAVCDVVVMHMCESTIQPKATLGCSVWCGPPARSEHDLDIHADRSATDHVVVSRRQTKAEEFKHVLLGHCP